MGDETVNGVFSIASFDILLEFFKAHVSPYEPTRNPLRGIVITYMTLDTNSRHVISYFHKLSKTASQVFISVDKFKCTTMLQPTEHSIWEML